MKIITSQQQGTGTVKVNARGATAPQEQEVQFLSLETPTIETDPANGEVDVGGVITFTISDVTTDITSSFVLSDESPADGYIEVLPDDDSDQYTIKVKALQPGSLKLKIEADSIDPTEHEFTILVPDTISLDMEPASANVLDDEEILVSVTGTTKNITMRASDPKIVVTPTDDGDPANKEFTISATGPVMGDIIVEGVGVETLTQEVIFREFDIITVTPEEILPTDIEDEIVLTVSGTERAITARSTNPNIDVQVSDKTLTITATDVGTSEIIISGDHVQEKIVEVRFTSPDRISLVLEPSNGTTTVGERIFVRVEGTDNRDLKFRSNNGDIRISETELDFSYVVEAVAPVTDATIEFYGDDIKPSTATVNFTEVVPGPQFNVDVKDITLNVSQLPYTFSVTDLSGNLVATSSTNYVVVSASGDEVTIESIKPGKLPIKGKITLHVDGQVDKYVTFTIDPLPELPKMDCDGIEVVSNPGKEVYFNVPMKDEDDVVEVTCSSRAVDIEERDANRIYVKSDTLGTYILNVTHTEYKPATVTFKVIEEEVIIVPEEEDKTNYYDLGACPDVEIQITDGNVVESVFTSSELSSDKERLSYVMKNGSFVSKDILNVLCSYNSSFGDPYYIPSDDEIGRFNRRVFQKIFYVLNIEDYRTFQEQFRLIIKAFKVYKDAAFQDIRLMRGEDGWKGSPTELEQYKMIVSFICKYIEQNGQNVSVPLSTMPFSDRITDKLVEFCSKNIVP